MLLISFIFPWAVIGHYDIYIRTSWNELDTTAVDDLEPGETVRIEGVIDEPVDHIAIGGYVDDDGKNPQWKWNDRDVFTFSDGNGSVNVTTEDNYYISKGPHPAPNMGKTKGTAYQGQDHVVIIGRVRQEGNGSIVHLLWIGTDEDDISPAGLTVYGTGLISIFSAVGIIYMLRNYFIFHRIHSEKVKHAAPVPFEDFDLLDEPSLEWRRNTARWYPLITPFAILLPLSTVVIFVITIFSTHIHTQDHYASIALIMMVMNPMAIFLPLSFFIDISGKRPKEVAFSETGIYFNYSGPELRYLKSYFTRWDEIFRISNKKQQKNARIWTLEKKNGEKVTLPKIAPHLNVMMRKKLKEYQESHKSIDELDEEASVSPLFEDEEPPPPPPRTPDSLPPLEE